MLNLAELAYYAVNINCIVLQRYEQQEMLKGSGKLIRLKLSIKACGNLLTKSKKVPLSLNAQPNVG